MAEIVSRPYSKEGLENYDKIFCKHPITKTLGNVVECLCCGRVWNSLEEYLQDKRCNDLRRSAQKVHDRFIDETLTNAFTGNDDEKEE